MAGPVTVAQANYDPAHKTHTFKLSLDELRKPNAAGEPFSRALAMSMLRPNALFYIADVEVLSADSSAQPLRDELERAKREIKRLTFELGNQQPAAPTVTISGGDGSGVKAAPAWDPSKLTREQLLSDDLEIPTGTHAGKRGYRALRQLCIEYGCINYAQKPKATLAQILFDRFAELNREAASTAHAGGH